MSIPLFINRSRVVVLKDGAFGSGPVVYWMSRDQRAKHNWALLEAARLAIELQRPLIVVFTLVNEFVGATFRHFSFMLKGLRDTEENLHHLNIPMVILLGDPTITIAKFVANHDVAALVCDFDPLRIKQQWKFGLLSSVAIPVYEVDAHNIVPCRVASPKLEYGAYTLRPKILKLLPDFLDQFPEIPSFFNNQNSFQRPDFDVLLSIKGFDRSVGEVSTFKSGSNEAERYLTEFIQQRLTCYDADRNNPTKSVISNLSPYIHFGQISAQHIVQQIIAQAEPSGNRDAFLEQLIVRRELSDNYCWYNPNYDSYDGFPDWSKRSHEKHKNDQREYLYSLETFENAQTHDLLWNAAQREMVNTGKMHSYMRMYWAKKIVEWTPNVREAMAISLYLNDRYELDGRDPNGYVGCAWAIGGVHDRAWFERPVFGQIRYMNYNGCKSKFDVKLYFASNS